MPPQQHLPHPPTPPTAANMTARPHEPTPKSRTTSLTIIEPPFLPRPRSISTMSLGYVSPTEHQRQQQRPRTSSTVASLALTTGTGRSREDEKEERLTPQTSPEIEGREADDTGPVETERRWTPALADRLAYVQRMKWESQKRWSAGQEVWGKEEETLLETRRAHRKALKKSVHAKASVAVDFEAELDHQCEGHQQRKRIEDVMAVWKKKTFSRAGKGRGGVEDDDEVDDLEMDFEESSLRVSSSPTQPPKGLKGLIRRMSGAKADAN